MGASEINQPGFACPKQCETELNAMPNAVAEHGQVPWQRDRSVVLSLKTCEDLWRPVKTCEDLWRPVKTCEDLWRPVKTCEDLWRPVKTCEDLWRPVKTCEDLWRPVKTCEDLWRPVKTCEVRSNWCPPRVCFWLWLDIHCWHSPMLPMKSRLRFSASDRKVKTPFHTPVSPSRC